MNHFRSSESAFFSKRVDLGMSALAALALPVCHGRIIALGRRFSVGTLGEIAVARDETIAVDDPVEK